jgi:hypothetical protein
VASFECQSTHRNEMLRTSFEGKRTCGSGSKGRRVDQGGEWGRVSICGAIPRISRRGANQGASTFTPHPRATIPLITTPGANQGASTFTPHPRNAIPLITPPGANQGASTFTPHPRNAIPLITTPGANQGASTFTAHPRATIALISTRGPQCRPNHRAVAFIAIRARLHSPNINALTPMPP